MEYNKGFFSNRKNINLVKWQQIGPFFQIQM